VDGKAIVRVPHEIGENMMGIEEVRNLQKQRSFDQQIQENIYNLIELKMRDFSPIYKNNISFLDMKKIIKNSINIDCDFLNIGCVPKQNYREFCDGFNVNIPEFGCISFYPLIPFTTYENFNNIGIFDGNLNFVTLYQRLIEMSKTGRWTPPYDILRDLEKINEISVPFYRKMTTSFKDTEYDNIIVEYHFTYQSNISAIPVCLSIYEFDGYFYRLNILLYNNDIGTQISQIIEKILNKNYICDFLPNIWGKDCKLTNDFLPMLGDKVSVSPKKKNIFERLFGN
jgi:hypothetical protein